MAPPAPDATLDTAAALGAPATALSAAIASASALEVTATGTGTSDVIPAIIVVFVAFVVVLFVM